MRFGGARRRGRRPLRSVDHAAPRTLRGTGIAAAELAAAPGWYAVSVGPLLPLVKVMRCGAPAEQLRRRICANLATQRDPEFCNIVAVRRPADLDERIPHWVSAFLQHYWGCAVAASRVADAAL